MHTNNVVHSAGRHLQCIKLLRFFRNHRGAGHWLFSNRRLLDPRTPQDLQTLQHNYDNLCNCFPVFASVTRARFLECFTAICTEWSKCLHDAQFGTGSASPDADSPGDHEGSGDQRGTSGDEQDAAGGGTGDWQPPSKRARGGRGGAGAELEGERASASGGVGGGGGVSGGGSWHPSDSDASSDEESDSPGLPASAPHSTHDSDPSHSDPPPNHGASDAAVWTGGGSGGGGGGSGEAPDSESVDRWYPVAPLQSGEVDYDPLAAP